MNRNIHCVLTTRHVKWFSVFYIYLQNENKVDKYHNYFTRDKGKCA